MSRRIKMGKDPRNRERPYVVRWTDGPDQDGKLRWFSRAFKYKLEAADFAAEKRVEHPAPPGHETQAVTVAHFRKEWFATVAPKRRVATADLYRELFDRIEDFFGKTALLSDITPQRAEQFVISQKPLRITERKKTLAAATRNQYLRNLRALLNVAVKWGYLDANPVQGVEDEEMQQAPFHHLTPEQEKALLEQAPTPRHKALYDLLLTTGLRLNEALSRTWREIDFEHGSLIIIDRKGTPDLPPFFVKARKKTGKNWRVIPLSPSTLDLLTELQARASEGVPYVFLSRERYDRVLAKWRKIAMQDRLWKNRWLTNNALRDFKLHCRKAGIKPDGKLCLHSLRKNTAQNMADAGLPLKVLQEILGHSKAETLLEYYQQMEEHHAKLVRDLMQQRRSGTPAKPAESPQRYVSGTYEAQKSSAKE